MYQQCCIATTELLPRGRHFTEFASVLWTYARAREGKTNTDTPAEHRVGTSAGKKWAGIQPGKDNHKQADDKETMPAQSLPREDYRKEMAKELQQCLKNLHRSVEYEQQEI